MASRKKILFPRSEVPGRAPTLNEIDFGEIAVNTHDGKAYLKMNNNGEVSIKTIGSEEVENVYYVSQSGALGNDGKSLGNAFLTLDSAVATVFTKENFKFDETICERDLHLIMDAVRYDMALGTNYGSITAGQSYKRGNAIKVTAEQLYQTRRSINEERLGMVSVPEVKNDAVSKGRVSEAFDEIIEILVGGEANALEYPDPPIEAQTDANAAATAIINNKDAIQDAVLDYLNDPANDFNVNAYDVTACSRDVGLIVNAVARDLLLGTDYNTVTAGWAYKRANSAYVLSDQKDATIAGINFARDYIIALAGVTSDTDIENLFKTVTNVIDGTQTVYPAINYPTTAGATYQIADRIAATTAIQTNRQTLIDDTSSFIATTYPNFAYGSEACERDVGYILDGLSHDVKYGGNTATRTNALAYFVGTASQLGSEEVDETVAAYNDLKTRILALIPASTQATVGGLVDEITGVITAGNTTGLAAEVNIDTTGLTTTEYDAIVAGISAAQDATIDYVNENFATQLGGYDAAKCARDTGLILDAVARDLLLSSTYWTITAGNAYLRANSAYVLSDQKQATIDAVNFAKSQVKALVGALDATIDTLFERVIDVLDGTVTTPIVAYSYPTNGTYASTRGAQVTAITSARATLITDTISYITSTFDTPDNLGYDQTTCERDTGFLIDALVADLTYDGNTASRQAALAYFVGTQSQLSPGTNTLGQSESSITVAAFTDLATRIKALANVTDDADVDTLVAIVTDAITAGNIDGVPAEEEVSTAGLTTTDFDAIVANRLIIQNDVIDFVNDSTLSNNFDQHKCERDTGLIVDAIALDLQNNTNYNSTTAGLAYRRGNAQKVQSDQLIYTVQSIEYLRDQINASGINADSQTFVTARIKEITDLLTESTEYGAYDGDPLTFTGSGSEDAAKRNAANALIVNRLTIQNQLITWIQDNYDALEYDQDKCKRDVGYIVDALTHDILFDGSFATDTNARSYWVGKDLNIEGLTDYENLDGVADVWINQLGAGEIVASAAAYEQLKTIVNNYITTSTEESRVETLIDVIISSIQAADGTGITVTLPAITGESATFYTNRSTLQEQVVSYANSIFPTYSYDQATCRRDVGYILDGLVYDLKYGGNSATSIAMRAYFSIFGNGYADRLGNSEFTATIAAYEQLKSIIAGYTAGTDTGNITKIQNLLNIIIQAVTQSRAGTFQLGDFFNPAGDVTGTKYAYAYPAGLPAGYNSLVFPNLDTLGITATFPLIQLAWTQFNIGTPERQTIIRQSSETAQNQGTDSTIFLKSGDYTVNNPIKLPPKTSIIGDALRATTIRPRNVDSDIFWVDNGCYVKEITFRDHQNGAACVAFDPRESAGSGSFITQSPYVQNCTSLTTSGIGMKIDGSKVSGLRSMVLDAFTQFNADGIGVLMQNRAYAQLVSCFTISTSTSIKAESGSQCSLTNSNSSFGDFGLVATGGSKSIYNGDLHADYNLNDDIIRVNGIINTDSANYSLQLGDFKKPNYNDAIKFANDSYYYTILNVSDEITQNWSVSLNNDQVVVNSTDLPQGTNTGKSVLISKDDNILAFTSPSNSVEVEVFQRSGTAWNALDRPQTTNPINTFGATSSNFGTRLASNREGTTIAVNQTGNKYVVGATNSTTLHGAVYILQTTDGINYNQIQFITDSVSSSPNPTTNRKLGSELSMSGDGNTLLISNEADSDSLFVNGAVNIYNRDSANDINGFQKAQKLLFPKGTTSGAPTTALSEDGASILVSWRGNVHYYYTKNQFGVFSLSQNIVSQLGQNDEANFEVTINGDASYAAFSSPDTGETFNTTVPAQVGNSVFFDVDDTTGFEVGMKIYYGTSIVTEDPGFSVVPNTIPAQTYIVDVVSATSLELSNPVGPAFDGVGDFALAYFENEGGAEFFQFDEGAWNLQETVYPSNGRGNQELGAGTNTRYGQSLDMNDTGDIAIIGAVNGSSSVLNNDSSAAAYIVERAGTNWAEVAILQPQNPQFNGDTNGSGTDDRFGEAVTVGGTGDYIAVGASNRLVEGTSGSVFTYSSILPETGSFELTIAPPLNKNAAGQQKVDFHQRSLISASSHTFEFVGSGTNMFAAVPQNGGIPRKENEIVFDSAESLQPNFGLVYFTATDELGDFRIGGDLTINRESGTITGTTFDRSLFAVLTPYILALEGS